MVKEDEKPHSLSLSLSNAVGLAVVAAAPKPVLAAVDEGQPITYVVAVASFTFVISPLLPNGDLLYVISLIRQWTQPRIGDPKRV